MRRYLRVPMLHSWHPVRRQAHCLPQAIHSLSGAPAESARAPQDALCAGAPGMDHYLFDMDPFLIGMDHVLRHCPKLAEPYRNSPVWRRTRCASSAWTTTSSTWTNSSDCSPRRPPNAPRPPSRATRSLTPCLRPRRPPNAPWPPPRATPRLTPSPGRRPRCRPTWRCPTTRTWRPGTTRTRTRCATW